MLRKKEDDISSQKPQIQYNEIGRAERWEGRERIGGEQELKHSEKKRTCSAL